MNNVKYNLKIGKGQYPLVCGCDELVFLKEYDQKLNDLFYAIGLQYDFRLKSEEIFLLMILHILQEQKSVPGEKSYDDLDEKNTELMKNIYFCLHKSLEDVLS